MELRYLWNNEDDTVVERRLDLAELNKVGLYVLNLEQIEYIFNMGESYLRDMSHVEEYLKSIQDMPVKKKKRKKKYLTIDIENIKKLENI
jgi:hypothetical protein